ncbi:MAG: DUF445 domain-containing protein [Schwartzia sp.]|nr:DUF445 domain-containing protein [Schwartzia sp. (in: firmicutes)]
MMAVTEWVKNWNSADKTLASAAALFVVALITKISIPNNVFVECFLFVTEAALVGGVADWFAVTALFEKPLGFPYHTAILPNRREEFIVAATHLVEREFFSRKKVFSMMEAVDLRTPLISWIKNSDVKNDIKNELMRLIQGYAEPFDCSLTAEKWAGELRHAVLSVPLHEVMERFRCWLVGGRDREIIAQASSFIRSRVETDEARDNIKTMLQKIYDDKMEGAGLLGMFGSLFAQAFDVVSIDDMAEVIQTEILRLLDEAGEANSAIQTRMLSVFYDYFDKVAIDPALDEDFAKLKCNVIRDMPIEDTIGTALLIIKNSMTDGGVPAGIGEASIHGAIQTLTGEVAESCLSILESDPDVQKVINVLVHDVVGRSALEAREMMGAVTNEVMAHLTDDELNRIVYSKIEPDLLWIRMNGSIVGAIIGFALYAIMTMAKYL